MSIGKRVFEALEKLRSKDFEGALIPLSIAVDATAAKHFEKEGRQSFKKFIKDNFRLISRIAFTSIITPELSFPFNHPRINPGPNGFCSVVEIFYHAIRCGLLHKGCLPANLRFAEETKIYFLEGVLILPASLLSGLIVAVIASPTNAAESMPEIADWPVYRYGCINVSGESIPLAWLWGRRCELIDFLFGGVEFGPTFSYVSSDAWQANCAWANHLESKVPTANPLNRDSSHLRFG